MLATRPCTKPQPRSGCWPLTPDSSYARWPADAARTTPHTRSDALPTQDHADAPHHSRRRLTKPPRGPCRNEPTS